MKLPIYDTAKPSDIEGILQLQNINLKQNTTAKIWAKEGFTTLQYSHKLLHDMNTPHPHTVARVNDQVVGYCLVLLPQIIPQITALNPLSRKLERISFNSRPLSKYKYFIMGQVCVDKAYRGMGVFSHMYNHLRDSVASSYDMVVTEISDLNQRSMQAHLRHGFEVLHTYNSPSDEPWTIVVWDWQ